MKFAIIGGDSIETLPLAYREEVVATPYGDVVLLYSKLDTGEEVIFRPRQGVLTTYDPSHINYRANIFALNRIGVTHVIGLASVGACDYAYKVGSVCLLTDFIDFTHERPRSFDREHRKFLHTPMESVFCQRINDELESRILRNGIPYSGRGVYACVEGPRFETAAEVRMFRTLGANVVGMSLVPEAPLAKELGMHYAAVGVVSHHCTGMDCSVCDEHINEIIDSARSNVLELCFDLIRGCQGKED